MTQHPRHPSARSRSTVLAGAIAATLVGLSGLLVPASAVPSQAERDQAHADVATQTDRVSVLEGQLAAANAALAEADVAAALAGESYLAAEESATRARAAKATADTEAATAQQEADDASDALASVALASYRNGGGAATQAQVFLGADEFSDVLRRSAALSIATGAAGDTVLSAQDAQAAADVAATRATNAQETLDTREAAARTALEEADSLQADAEAQRTSTAAIVDGAVNELAVLRNHSVELELAYQADLADQLGRALVEANHWPPRVRLLGVKVEHVLHARDILAINLRNAPHLLPPGLERVLGKPPAHRLARQAVVLGQPHDLAGQEFQRPAGAARRRPRAGGRHQQRLLRA